MPSPEIFPDSSDNIKEFFMIYDTLNNLGSYLPLAPEAVKLLSKVLPDFSADSPNGKTVLIEGKLFILVQRYTTRSFAESKIETHSDFADLQMLLAGKEYIGYAAVDRLEVLTPYQLQDDYALFAAEEKKVTLLKLEPGNFAIFFPEEGHMPGCGDKDSVVKVVVKIHKSLLSF